MLYRVAIFDNFIIRLTFLHSLLFQSELFRASFKFKPKNAKSSGSPTQAQGNILQEIEKRTSRRFVQNIAS